MNTQNSLVPFAFDDALVRVHLDENGNPWFVAKDVARALEYPDASLAQMNNLTRHVPDEWKGHNPIMTPSGEQQMLTLSEPGLYFFLGRSDKPKALPFQKWLAGDVLPSLRKTGTYTIPGRDGRDTFSTGKDRARLREMVDEWARLSGYAEQVLWSVIRTQFRVSRINMLTLGQLPQVLAFLSDELDGLRREADVYRLPVNIHPTLGGV